MKKIICFVFFWIIFTTPVFSQGFGGSSGYGGGSSIGRGGLCAVPAGANTVNTALGNIPTEPAALVKWILCNAVALGGGIAFLLSVWGGLTIMLAAGNPEKINEGKEIIGSAITGLLFIIFSVFLLRLIGVNILKIPDFTN